MNIALIVGHNKNEQGAYSLKFLDYSKYSNLLKEVLK